MDEQRSSEQQLIELEQRWRDAIAEGDRDVAAAFMAPDFIFTAAAPAGVALDRDDWLDGVAVRHRRGSYEHDDFHVKVMGAVAMVQFRCRECGLIEPVGAMPEAYGETDVWRRIEDRWMVTSRHETHLPA